MTWILYVLFILNTIWFVYSYYNNLVICIYCCTTDFLGQEHDTKINW
jgi:hypothetical protein